MIPAQVQLFGALLEGTDIELFELTTAQEVIRLVRKPGGRTLAAGLPPEAAPEAATASTIIPAPSVGVFRRAHPSRPAPLVQPGQRVEEGEPVGLLQIGALLVHVVAPHDGTVLALLAEDGATIGYGAPLIRLTKADIA